MDLHRLAEARSLAYHRAVAALLEREPERLEVARARVREWLDEPSRSRAYALAWSEILDRPLPELLSLMVEDTERARALRQATPFAGFISPVERWTLWRAVRAELERAEANQ